MDQHQASVLYELHTLAQGSTGKHSQARMSLCAEQWWKHKSKIVTETLV